MYEIWKKAGSKDICSVLNERARVIFENHEPEALPDDIKAKISSIVINHKPDVL